MRARELLPDLHEAIELEATRRFGARADGETSLARLRQRLEKLCRFHDWFAQGKPAEFKFWPPTLPDGELSPQFVQCWKEAVAATPTLRPRFDLRRDGFRVPLPHGYYRFDRSVLLPKQLDDGSDVMLEVDEELLRKGGLYRLQITPDARRIVPLGSVLAHWRIALRMLRHFRPVVRREILRRLRAGVPFEFSRQGPALTVTLRCGRMPSEVRVAYRTRARLFRSRLDRVLLAESCIVADGQSAAERFAADPTIQLAQAAARREALIESYRHARDRLWQIASVFYVKRSLPQWPFRTPDEICGRLKSGVSPRRQLRLQSAIEIFQRAYAEVVECGWNPLDDSTPAHSRNRAEAQQVLPLGVAS